MKKQEPESAPDSSKDDDVEVFEADRPVQKTATVTESGASNDHDEDLEQIDATMDTSKASKPKKEEKTAEADDGNGDDDVDLLYDLC